MELTLTSFNEYLIVDVSGVVDSRAAGRLLDTLVAGVRSCGTKLIVDLSRVSSMTRAGARGLVVAARLSMAAGGGMRICGAEGAVASLLHGLGYGHLLKFDRDLETSIIALSPGAPQPVRRAA